jgi:opacity protein-like surface antigen
MGIRMFRNETFLILFTLFFSFRNLYRTENMVGEISGFAGGGGNDIFRFQELIGSGSVNGKGYWTAGIDISRLFGDHFSFETGLSYSHQYYFTSPAPGIGGEDEHGSLSLLTAPFALKVDFLKWFFADAGAVISLQPSLSAIDNMTGLGATLGAGFQYRFKSDLFIRVRAYAAQYALLHLVPEDYPRTMWNSGVTLGVGYRFIRLGKCNCPDDNNPVKKYYR